MVCWHYPIRSSSLVFGIVLGLFCWVTSVHSNIVTIKLNIIKCPIPTVSVQSYHQYIEISLKLCIRLNQYKTHCGDQVIHTAVTYTTNSQQFITTAVCGTLQMLLNKISSKYLLPHDEYDDTNDSSDSSCSINSNNNISIENNKNHCKIMGLLYFIVI